MTANALMEWYYGVADFLNEHLEELGAHGVYARFPAESFESPGPAVVLMMEFANENPPLTLVKPLTLKAEITVMAVSGAKATVRESITESLTILQAAAKLLRQGYAGDLMLSASPLEIPEASANLSVSGLIYEKLVSLI